MGISIGAKEYVKEGLVLFMDAANPASYPGSGTTWSDLSQYKGLSYNTATLGGDNIPTYSTDYGGLIFVDNYAAGDFTPPYGPTGYVHISYDDNITGSVTQLTFEMWIRIHDTTDADIQAILTFGNRYSFTRRTTGRIAFYSGADLGAGGYGLSFTSGDTEKWYHMVLVVNADGTLDSLANNKIYFNGVQQSLDCSEPLTGASSWPYFSPASGRYRFMLGYQTNSGMWAPPDSGRRASFDISVFKVYNGELTQDQVTQNFESLRGRYGI